MTTTKDKLEFALVMGRHTRASLRQVQALMRYAGTLRTLSQSTTDSISPGQDRIAAKRERIVRKVADICAELCGPQLSGPAGYVVPMFVGAVLKIRVPDGFTNDMGREGICVPS